MSYQTIIDRDPHSGWAIKIISGNRILWQSGARYTDPAHAKSALPALRRAMLFAGGDVKVYHEEKK